MWFWYGLGASFVSALSVILNKKALNKIGAPLVTWSLFAIPLPFLIYLAFKDGIPRMNVLLFLGAIGSGAVFVFSKTLSLHSFKKSLLSQVIPLISFSTLFTYVLGLIFLSERVKPIGVLGLLLIVCGAYVVNVEQAGEDIFKPVKIIFTNHMSLIYLISLFLASLSAIFDKVSLTSVVPSNPIFTLLIEDFVMVVALTGYMSHKDIKWFRELRGNFVILFIGAIVYTGTSLLVLYGFSQGSVALVSGIKRLEVIFILLFSHLFFGDKATKYSWFGTVIMLFGVFLIKLA